MAERRMPEVEDYPSNANGSAPTKPTHEPPEKLQLRGKVSKKSRGGVFKAAKDEFISEDAPNVGSYILYDLLLPALKDLILDIAHGSIDMAMGGGGGYRSRRGGYRDSRRDSYISYDRYYDDRPTRRRDRDDDMYRRRRRGERDLSEFTFEYADDAQDALDRMCDQIEEYGDVSVAYFYDICGETVPGDFTKDDWGWTNLAMAKVRGDRRRGYYIDFPRARAI